MLVRGNAKLGRSIWAFSIPAGTTCPGKSETCDSRCYAQKGFFVMPSAQRAFQRNLEASQLSDFPEQMIEEIEKNRCRVVRCHVSGDFYDAEYVKKWHKIVAATPNVIYFTYTRSWRIPEIRKELVKFAKACPNLRMWWSVDAETGDPKNMPDYIRCAYMSVAVYDNPSVNMDLVFRDYPLRGTTQKYINGVLVCPPENGVSDLQCEQCGICWRRTTTPHREPDPAVAKRVPLELVA